MNKSSKDLKQCTGYSMARRGAELGPRKQAGWQLWYVYEGRVDLWINRKPYSLGANEITLLKPGQDILFHFSNLGATRYGWCELNAQELALPDKGPWKQPFSLRLKKLARAARAAERVYGPNTAYAQSLRDAMQAVYLAGAEAGRVPANKGSRALQKAGQFMRARHHMPLTLKDVARAAGVTPSYLNRLYRDHQQTTPIHHLWEIRIAAAKDLLRNTAMPANEIAQVTGFQSPNHFSRMIKDNTGSSPLEYRRQAWRQL